jgi:hypothetical protein
MNLIQRRLLRESDKIVGRDEGKSALQIEARYYFALSLGCVSSPDVKVYSVDGLDQELTDSVSNTLKRDVQVSPSCGSSTTRTVMLPKVFKWRAHNWGNNRMAMLEFVADHLPEPLSLELREIAVTKNFKIKFLDFDWRKRSCGTKP